MVPKGLENRGERSICILWGFALLQNSSLMCSQGGTLSDTKMASASSVTVPPQIHRESGIRETA